MRALFIIILACVTGACNNYGLLDLLENPGRAQSEPLTSCGGNCRIFVSNQVRRGDFGGPNQADQICMTDSARPTGNRIWKALLVGNSRKACGNANCTGGTSEHVDWVMRPATNYYRPDGTFIAATIPSAGIWDLNFNLVSSVTPFSANPWTGLQVSWTMQAYAICHNTSPEFVAWVRGDNGQAGTVGASMATTDAVVNHNSTWPCNNFQPFYCVEQ